MQSRPHRPCPVPVTPSARDALPRHRAPAVPWVPHGQSLAQVSVLRMPFARVPRCPPHLRNINLNATVLQMGPRRHRVPWGSVHRAKGCCYQRSGLGITGRGLGQRMSSASFLSAALLPPTMGWQQKSSPVRYPQILVRG